jgi:hypothetical protein
MPVAIIESLDHEGRGVARLEGKAIFVEGALPRERVIFASYRRKPNYELATASQILTASALRVEPRCRHFGICGGCSMQHLNAAGQTAVKQRVLEDAFQHIARLQPEVVYPAIQGTGWAYRSRARLSVRLVPKKGGVLVGFHEKRSSYIADMDSCEVLPPRFPPAAPAASSVPCPFPTACRRSRWRWGRRCAGAAHSAGIAPADEAAAGLCRRAWHPVLAAAERSGGGPAFSSARCAAARLCLAGFRLAAGISPE